VTQRYDVRLARRAVRSLAHLQRQEQLRISAAIDLLAENPRPPGCVALQGEPGVFRVRVGDFWILYEVLDGLLLVQVVRIGHGQMLTAKGRCHRSSLATGDDANDRKALDQARQQLRQYQANIEVSCKTH
jgi:mRNA interferase RelE/StbE